MYLLKKQLLSLAVPPIGLLLVAFAGLILTYRRPRMGRILTAISLIGLLILSTPLAAGYLLGSLQKFPTISDKQLSGCQAIVVLGGGVYRGAPEYGGDTIGYTSLERLRYGVYLSKRSGLPIMVTGGAPDGGLTEAETMHTSARSDFSREIRWTESDSLNTAESARLSVQILKHDGIHRIALVSHAWHLPRAVALFETAGIEVIPAPTAFSHTSVDIGAFLPNTDALASSNRALHEWLGILTARLGLG